jgi:hypothetical protein
VPDLIGELRRQHVSAACGAEIEARALDAWRHVLLRAASRTVPGCASRAGTLGQAATPDPAGGGGSGGADDHANGQSEGECMAGGPLACHADGREGCRGVELLLTRAR